MQPWSEISLPVLPGQGLPILIRDVSRQRLVAPVVAGEDARLYVCGITPYDSTHMGHAATYLAFDVLQRAWRDSGSRVSYVQNVTDIDDPLFERARSTNQHWQDIALREMNRFRDDMTALRILPPDHYVTVTEHIQGIISWIELLVNQGCTYSLDGDLYFDLTGVTDFGAVSHLSAAQMIDVFAERGGDPLRDGKRSPLDPILWVRSKPDEPAWETSFGTGRPGWHIECVAIALDFLGDSLTVQGGGSDLSFPHHEMCRAQVQASGKFADFANTYLHAGMVSLDGAKMSKSLGNLVFVSQLRDQGVDPMAIRLAIMSNHYSSDWEWTATLLEQAQRRLELWRSALSLQSGADAEALLAQIRLALANDLDSPAALAAVDAWATASLSGDESDNVAQGLVARAIDALLGIGL